MARRKKIKIQIPPIMIRVFLIIFFASMIGFAVYKGLSGFLTRSPCFRIKVIEYDDALQFINKRELTKLKGENIFSVDLKEIQKKIQRRYPQITRLRIMRRFPDQIIVSARERRPFVQMDYDGKILTLDSKGIVLSTSSKRNKKLPFLSGIRRNNRRVILGVPLRKKGVFIALGVIEAFQKERMLAGYRINRVNLESLSKIRVILSNKLVVIVDRDKIASKLRKLGVVLTQSKMSSKEVKYIDIRFKEPIVKRN